jgi:hypothetical protein
LLDVRIVHGVLNEVRRFEVFEAKRHRAPQLVIEGLEDDVGIRRRGEH